MANEPYVLIALLAALVGVVSGFEGLLYRDQSKYYFSLGVLGCSIGIQQLAKIAPPLDPNHPIANLTLYAVILLEFLLFIWGMASQYSKRSV